MRLSFSNDIEHFYHLDPFIHPVLSKFRNETLRANRIPKVAMAIGCDINVGTFEDLFRIFEYIWFDN